MVRGVVVGWVGMGRDEETRFGVEGGGGGQVGRYSLTSARLPGRTWDGLGIALMGMGRGRTYHGYHLV